MFIARAQKKRRNGKHRKRRSPKRKRFEHSNTPRGTRKKQGQMRSNPGRNGSGESNAAASIPDGARQKELEDTSAELRRDPRLIERIGNAIAAGGYAGDVRPALLAYVAITSRLLERPMNVAFIAPSAAGKNRAVDAALELVPAEAVYIIRAASPTALIYSDAEFRHLTVFFSEADSIPEDGPAGSAIRSLAADNLLAYEVTELDPQTGKRQTRRIEKPGPTGLITTSTKSLGSQMGTRTLEVSLADDPAQTRAVMRAHASSVNPQSGDEKVDLAPFITIQDWLVAHGERRVAVPFGTALANLVPNTAVRMRRDFKQLLTAIQAIALLHQCQRERTAEGWIQATLEDYAKARRLLAPIFEATAADGLTPAIRETVEAVGTDERNVTESELVKRLNLVKSTVSYRVKRAIRGEWLINDEWRQGHPARLRRGLPLPDTTTALPTVEQVGEAFESERRSKHDSSGQAGGFRPEPGPKEEPFECSNEIREEAPRARRQWADESRRVRATSDRVSGPEKASQS